jgi:REP-associated tyrosine transposase
MQWLLTNHVRRHHRRYGTSGRIWQGRYKSFPIQHDRHLLLALRYVERNPLRAGLVHRAEEWRWSSLHDRATSEALLLTEPPVARLVDWSNFINDPGAASELESLRTSARKGRPFGDPVWIDLTVARLALQSTLRSRGRPRQGFRSM